MDLALLIGVVGLVVVGMGAYIRRGVQGKIKDVTDYIVSDRQSPEENPVYRSTRLRSDSRMTAKEFNKGARSLYGDEYSSTEYNEHSESSSKAIEEEF
jgi:hypothetical protein